MSNLGDDVTKGTILGVIIGFPIVIIISILAIPFVIISVITDIPMSILLLNLSVFVIALLVVALFSRYQIIENGIVGLIAGALVYIFLKWHALFCILIGVAIVGVLFYITNIKIGFWIKAILFSIIETFIVFMCIYSEIGLYPMSDKIWKVFFVIIFFLENILVRCTVAVRNSLLFDKYTGFKKKRYHNCENERDNTEFGIGEHNGDISIGSKQAISSDAKLQQNIISNTDETLTSKSLEYCMNHIFMISKRRKFWDSDIEMKTYSVLRSFIDDAYIILPHVAFREIFYWGKWESDWKLTDRVTKMHFDFGIYNDKLQPVLFIELYGKQHYDNPEVMERDKFKAELMKKCDLKMIAIDFSGSVADNEIVDKLIERIKEEVPNREAYPAYCPHCGSLLKIKQNNLSKEYFYGCETYKKGSKDNCPTTNISDVPPLYIGMPIIKS